MKNRAIALVAFLAAGLYSFAEDLKTVYLISPADAPPGGAWELNMAMPSEVARLCVPSAYQKKLFSTRIESASTLSYIVRGIRELERSDLRVLREYSVLVSGLTPLPRPDRRVTVSFSLADLVRKGGEAADLPLWYAMRLAVAKAPWIKGLVWLESIQYDGMGLFTAIVAVKKG